MNESGLAELLKRDRLVVVTGLVIITLLAWAYTIWMAMTMNIGASSMVMPQSDPWTVTHAMMIFIMWAVMMVAMMLPSAAPMIITYAQVASNQKSGKDPGWSTMLFAVSYLMVWALYSLAATAAQWGLHSISYLSPIMATNDKYIGGAILVAAAIFQITPLKNACLTHCRAPMGYFITNWRDGSAGAFKMGFWHGAYCVGCCWAIMAVLFVTGIMNLLWVAVLSLFVLLEKVAPNGNMISRFSAALLLTVGLWMMIIV